MKKQKKLLMTISFFTSLTLGCSDVAFQPGPPVDTANSADSVGADGSGRDRGLSGTVYETFFATATNTGGKVDILFVVDNSTSMYLEQQKLGQRLSTFIDSLSGLDWQIGITTTDVTTRAYGIKGSLVNLEGAPGQILNDSVPNYEQVFENTVVRSETIDCSDVCPSSTEQPLAATIMAVQKRNSDNAGFFRSDANLAVIMLSDEDEMSDAPSAATTPVDFMNAMDLYFGTSKRVTVFGILVIPGDTFCFEDQRTRAYYGTYVSQLAQMTSGLLGSICDTDYTRNLRNIGERVKQLQDKLVLSKDPVHGTVEITFVPKMDIQWSLEGKTIKFNADLPEGTQIDISYLEVDAE